MCCADFSVITSIVGPLIGVVVGAAIAHFSNRNIAKLEHERLIKEKAAIVADFLAKWQMDALNKDELLSKSYELAIYLPSELYLKLNKRLTNQPGAPDSKEIIMDVRKHLLGDKDLFDPLKIVHWK